LHTISSRLKLMRHKKGVKDISQLATAVIKNPIEPALQTVSPVDPAVKTASLETVVDRVNNVEHKESAMSKAGVTRRKTYAVICELLEAVKTKVGYDEKGFE